MKKIFKPVWDRFGQHSHSHCLWNINLSLCFEMSWHRGPWLNKSWPLISKFIKVSFHRGNVNSSDLKDLLFSKFRTTNHSRSLCSHLQPIWISPNRRLEILNPMHWSRTWNTDTPTISLLRTSSEQSRKSCTICKETSPKIWSQMVWSLHNLPRCWSQSRNSLVNITWRVLWWKNPLTTSYLHNPHLLPYFLLPNNNKYKYKNNNNFIISK